MNNTKRKSIGSNTIWKHCKGSIYHVVGIGKYASLTRNDLLWTKYARQGSFANPNASEEKHTNLDLWQYGDFLTYGSYQDLGDIVFYYGKCGRWFRSKEEFLGKNEFNEYNFIEMSTETESVLLNQ
jgi:hypothetical protein